MNSGNKIHTPDDDYEEIGTDILRNIRDMGMGNFDTFSSLLNNLIWQSPAELGTKLIIESKPGAWKSLQSTPSDTIIVRQTKETARKRVFQSVQKYLLALSQCPTVFQSISTRLLVQQIFVSSLPAVDQDRMMSAELMIQYRNWQRLLSTIITHDILAGGRFPVESPFSYIDSSGRDMHIITVSGHIEPIESIPELPIRHTDSMVEIQVGTGKCITPIKISEILLDERVLICHDGTISNGKKETAIRELFLQIMQNPSAYRKFSFGNQKQTPKIEGELHPYGV